ncbi:MAG: hypothetical protein NC191_03395 [Muribaculaceae bacterium]|nr:hypothetical protein [Muribaculaceae bacterium]
MSLKSTLTYIGKNVKPYWPTVAVASAELIFRPLFTMMDKKSPEETKKYTALREGITELIAAPTYLALPILAAKGSDLLKIKDANLAKMAKHNLQTVGTWTAALVVIPGLCSAMVKPFMDKIYKNGKPGEESSAKLDVTSKSEQVELPKTQVTQTGNIAYSPVQKISLSAFRNGSMKVGG